MQQGGLSVRRAFQGDGVGGLLVPNMHGAIVTAVEGELF